MWRVAYCYSPTINCAKTNEPIEMLFWIGIRLWPKEPCMEALIPQGKGQFWGDIIRPIVMYSECWACAKVIQ